jgi:hypothetical protein
LLAPKAPDRSVGGDKGVEKSNRSELAAVGYLWLIGMGASAKMSIVFPEEIWLLLFC